MDSRQSRRPTIPAPLLYNWFGGLHPSHPSTGSFLATRSPTGQETTTPPTAPPWLPSRTPRWRSSPSRTWPASRSTWSRYGSSIRPAWGRRPKWWWWLTKEVRTFTVQDFYEGHKNYAKAPRAVLLKETAKKVQTKKLVWGMGTSEGSEGYQIGHK